MQFFHVMVKIRMHGPVFRSFHQFFIAHGIQAASLCVLFLTTSVSPVCNRYVTIASSMHHAIVAARAETIRAGTERTPLCKFSGGPILKVDTKNPWCKPCNRQILYKTILNQLGKNNGAKESQDLTDIAKTKIRYGVCMARITSQLRSRALSDIT